MRMPKTPRPSMNCLALPSTPSLFFVCGAVGEGNPPSSRPSSIMVKSATAQICAERTQQFLVTFSGLAVPSDCADNAEQNRGDQSENEATQPAPHCAGNVRMKLGITWSVSSAPGGNVTAGTINAKGLYISPATLSSPHSVKRKLPIVRFQRQHLKPNPNCVFRFTERRFGHREFHNHNRWAQVSKRYEVISMIQTTRAMMSKYCNSCRHRVLRRVGTEYGRLSFLVVKGRCKLLIFETINHFDSSLSSRCSWWVLLLGRRLPPQILRRLQITLACISGFT